MKLPIFTLALLIATPTFAQTPAPKPEAPPAVACLTATELQSLVNAEVGKALAAQTAKAVYEKVNAALAPKPEPKEPSK